MKTPPSNLSPYSEDSPPPSFLVRCANGGGFTVLHNGVPICAETTRESALICASRARLDLPAVFWDGDSASFLPVASLS
jgi:hypothetical protein